MDLVNRSGRVEGRLAVAEDDREGRLQRPQEPFEAAGAVGAVLGKTLCDERMSDLHEESATAAEQDDSLGVDAANRGLVPEGEGVRDASRRLLSRQGLVRHSRVPCYNCPVNALHTLWKTS